MNPVRGIALKLLAVALFSVMAACVKAAQEIAPPGQAVFFRALIALVPVIGYALWRRALAQAVSRRNLRGHFWRGVIGGTAMGLSFAALGLLPLPEVVAIGFTAPIFVTILAIWLLGETVRIYRWTAVIFGLIGVAIMTWPRLSLIRDGGLADGEALGAVLMLAAAFLMALAQIHIRWLSRTEPTLAIVFWFHVTVSVGALASLPFGWVWPDAATWALLIAAGIFGGTAQILVTESYRISDASTLAPFEYSAMLYGLAIGYAVFGEVPGAMVMAGACVVIGAGLFILHRERQLGLAQKRAAVRAGMAER